VALGRAFRTALLFFELAAFSRDCLIGRRSAGVVQIASNLNVQLKAVKGIVRAV
jgi:hypothetical protein